MVALLDPDIMAYGGNYYGSLEVEVNGEHRRKC